MSRLGKIALALAGFSLLFVAIPRVFLEEWNNYLFFPLIAFLVFMVLAVIKDFRFYLEFMTMKTTKHGMNMGVLILLAFVLLATVNYLSVHFLGTVKFDWTKEKLNSLSDQSVSVLKGLDSDLEVKFFFGRGIQEVDRVKEQFKSLSRLYEDKSQFVKIEFIDSIRRPDLAEEFRVDSGDSVIFVRYKGARQRVDKIDEEGLTNAILKVTHTKKRVAYFVTGHGERDIDSKDPNGLYDFKQLLEGSQYAVKPLKIFEENKIPADADLVMVVGPQQNFLDGEAEHLRNYARQGGKLLLALDPGQRHNLAGLVKTFGLEFENNYIVDPAARLNTNALGIVLGLDYSRTSELTKQFTPNMMTLFYLASALKRAPDAAPTLQIEEAVKTGPQALLSAEVPRPTGLNVLKDSEGSKTVMATVSGTLPKADAKKDEKPDAKDSKFWAVVVGDSDFLTNQFLFQLTNRDLALNSVAFLARDTDMITIRPKLPTGSQLTLTNYQTLGLLLTYVVVTLLLFISGGVIWFRRKYA